MLTTKGPDFQSGQLVPDATVTVFKNQDFANPFATAMSNTDTAELSFSIPSGTTRFGYKMTSENALPTFLLNQKLSSATTTPQTESEIRSVSNATAATLPALIGQTRIVGTSVVAGGLRDCKGHEVSGLVATMSTTSATATPAAGAEAYYFDSSVGLPVNHRRAQYSTGDGLFMIIQVPTDNPVGYVQMWGYPPGTMTSGPMTLIAELQVPVLGDNVITGSYEPLRSN